MSQAQHMQTRHAPRIFRVQTEEDLDRIPFENGMAAVEIPARLLDHIELRNDFRGDSQRLDSLVKSIRSKGFQPIEPITARIGRKGRWVVINGGHRLTAARRVMGEWWSNLFGPRVESFYFILFTNPDSWADVGKPPGITETANTVDELHQVQDAWERARQRNHLAGTERPG